MPKPVIHDHDGHVDDLISCILLWLAPQVELEVVGITNGDCFHDQAYEAMIKIATYLNLERAEIAVSPDPMPNPFPDNWRRESYIINELPLFSENDFRKPYPNGKGRRVDSAFADCLANSKAPVTIVATGPMTNVSMILKAQPELRSKVAEIVIMGGAINVPGNVTEDGHDGSAEWNVYADPQAFKNVLEYVPNIKLISLDLTNKIPVSQQFLSRLEAQAEKYRASTLALKLWSLVRGFDYYFWDTITAAAAIDPSIFTFKEMKIDVAVQGKSMGKTSTSIFSGRKIQVATNINSEKFENLLLTILGTR